MKLVVIGATGGCGKELVKQALDANHEVTVIARNPEKLSSFSNDHLSVVKGNIFSEEELAEHFKDKDAVLSALGSTDNYIYKYFGKITLYSESIKPIIGAMRKAEVNRFLCITSWCTKYNKDDPGHFFLEWLIKPLLLGNILKDMATMEDFLVNECPDLTTP